MLNETFSVTFKHCDSMMMVLFLARLWRLFHFHLQYVLHLFTRGGIGCLWQRCGRCILRKIQQIVYSGDTRRFFQPKSLCYGGSQGTLQFFDADGTTCGYIITTLHLWYTINTSVFSVSISRLFRIHSLFVFDTDLSWSCQHFYTLCSRLNFGPNS